MVFGRYCIQPNTTKKSYLKANQEKSQKRKNTHLHITSAILLDNGQISNIHGSNFKIVVQLTLPKLTSPCFLQLEGTRGVVNDLNIVFECKKLVLGHKTQKFMILIWYWVGIVFYPIPLESHTQRQARKKVKRGKTLICIYTPRI